MRSTLVTTLLTLTASTAIGCSGAPGDGASTTGAGAITVTSSPTVKLTLFHEVGMQPGWVRAVFNYSVSGNAALIQSSASATCRSGADPKSITTSVTPLSATQVAVDVRANLAWLATNGLPTPCTVSKVTLDYALTSAPSTPIATASAPYPFAMDLPVAYLSPSQLSRPISGTSVALQPPAATRRYFAYPPQIVAIQSNKGRTAFAEVEELIGRGTLGLRAMTSFFGSTLDRELGGGAELYSSWGLDVDYLGVTKTTAGVEESHPGFDTFASYAGSAFDTLLSPNPAVVFPAPPQYLTSTYMATVLDNHGVQRCPGGRCLDVQYDDANHVLNAINGATIQLLDSGPIEPGVAPPAQAQLTTVTGAPTLTTSKATDLIVTAAPSQVIAETGLRCVLNGTTVTAPLTRCGGNSAAVRCPTPADPLVPDALPYPTTTFRGDMFRGDQMSLSALMPIYGARENVYGDCESHAQTSDEEYLKNRLAYDLLPSTAINVDGQTIPVPNPALAISIAGGYSLGETRNGYDTALNHKPTWGTSNVAPIALGYWPALERDYSDWAAANSGNSAVSPCSGGQWAYDAFCTGQGQPPPGTYWQYSQMAAAYGTSPLLSGFWGLANHYFNMASQPIAYNTTDIVINGVSHAFAADDSAAGGVMAALQSGLPVYMTLRIKQSSLTDPTGYATNMEQDPSWFLPAQLAGCTPQQLGTAFGWGEGHAVDIVGYSVSRTSPNGPIDPVSSYFVIENNWGKFRGYSGFFAMNFAAFKYMVTGLATYQLDCALNSIACRRPGNVLGDVDGDHRADIALTGLPAWNTVPVGLSNGSGSFTPTNDGAGLFPTFAAQLGAKPLMGDFDGDGLTDIAFVGGLNPTTNQPWSTIPVAFSRGDGSFDYTNQAVADFTTEATQAGAQAVAGDFNGDGLADIALVGGFGWNTIPVALSSWSGRGNFIPSNNPNPTFETYASQGGHLVATDFDGDGKADLALTGGAGWNTIPVAFASGGATFTTTNVPISGSFPLFASQGPQIVAGDFTGDGFGDIALAGGPGWQTISIASYQADGTFAQHDSPAAQFDDLAAQGGQLVAGDYNGDGFTDLALVGGTVPGGAPWNTIPVGFSVGDGTFVVTNNGSGLTAYASQTSCMPQAARCVVPTAVSASQMR